MNAVDMTTVNQTSDRNPDHQPQSNIQGQQVRGQQVTGQHVQGQQVQQQPGRAAGGARGRSTVAFGARAAILAGAVATACAAAAPAVGQAGTAHHAVHATTAVALGGTSGGVATPLDSTAGM